MSTATLDMNSIVGEEDGLHYRALHTGALIGSVLGVLSIFVVITAVNSFGACLLVAPIPLLGIIVSLWSLMKIRRQSDQYTGAHLAILGLALSLLFLVGGVSYGGYVYATELPNGYSRISFNTMKPDELQERSGAIVPPEIAALEGKSVFIKGYIRQDSIKSPVGIDEFLLVRDNQQCCFGDLSSVKYYDRVMVKMTGDHRVAFSPQVFRIGGVLHIEPQYARPGSPKTVFTLTADYAK